MSENIIGYIEVQAKTYHINWPHSQVDVGFDPNYASATLVDDSKKIDYDNYFTANILPVEGASFTTEADVWSRAEEAILTQLAINLLTGPQATTSQIEVTASMVANWSLDEIRAVRCFRQRF